MKTKEHKKVTKRAIIISLILIPFNCYFLINNHIYLSALPTTISLFYNVIIWITLLIVINFAIKRLSPRYAFKRSELLTIYSMMAVASAMAGHDMLQTVVPALTHGFWYATPENDWKRLFWQYLPSWLVMEDFGELPPYYHGETSLFTGSRYQPWVIPTLWWTAFFTMLATGMVCINTIIHKCWIKRERLSYPIIQLPLEMTSNSSSFFRSRLMWIGFAIAAILAIGNGIHHIFPTFPEIPNRKHEIGALFTQKPWNAIGWTPMYVFPFAVGLSFFMPLSLSFSFWFFYWFWKAMRVLGSMMGLHNLPGFPYSGQQTTGAYIAIVVLALWRGRRHLVSVFKSAFNLETNQDSRMYRYAFIGLTFSIIFLSIFSHEAGMSTWAVLVYFALYYLLGLSITRISAELGPPTHEMFDSTPHRLMNMIFGTRRLGPRNLTVMSLYWGFNRGYRAHPMPHTLEAFKLAEQGKMEKGRLSIAMIIAAMFGSFFSYWVFIEMSYRIGAVNNPPWGGSGHLQNWLYHVKTTDFLSLLFIGIGAIFTVFLQFMRTRFLWWKLHPAGFALTGSIWTVGWLWFSIFISWAIKSILLKHGGIGKYRKAVPLFLGLILGDFIVGGMWIVIRLFTGMDTYVFWR